MVGKRLAGGSVDDDLAGLDDDMAAGQDLGSLDLKGVQALQLQLPESVGRFRRVRSRDRVTRLWAFAAEMPSCRPISR